MSAGYLLGCYIKHKATARSLRLFLGEQKNIMRSGIVPISAGPIEMFAALRLDDVMYLYTTCTTMSSAACRHISSAVGEKCLTTDVLQVAISRRQSGYDAKKRWMPLATGAGLLAANKHALIP